MVCLLLAIVSVGCTGRQSSRSEGFEQKSAVAPDARTKVFVWFPKTGDTLGATVSSTYENCLRGLQDIKEEGLIMTADKTTGFNFAWHVVLRKVAKLVDCQ